MRFTDWYCDKAQDFIAARTGLDRRPLAIHEVPANSEALFGAVPFVRATPAGGAEPRAALSYALEGAAAEPTADVHVSRVPWKTSGARAFIPIRSPSASATIRPRPMAR